MNRNVLNLLALVELALAVLFTVVCAIVFFVQPDSLLLQLSLVFIGIAGIYNGIFLFRRIKESRTPVGRRANSSRPIPNQRAKRSNSKK